MPMLIEAPAGYEMRLGGMEEGEFRVTMPSLPAGFYLKEARLDGADMLHGFASIAFPGKLELVISSSGGSVDGIVVDEQGRAFPGAQAVLVPDQRERTDLFKGVLSDANGRFSISGIAPGTYRVFAWADLEDYAYFDPAVVERYADQARAVRIEKSSRQAVELKAIEGAQP